MTFDELCDQVDAAVFSSDTLLDQDTLTRFKLYVESWGREVQRTLDMLTDLSRED